MVQYICYSLILALIKILYGKGQHFSRHVNQNSIQYKISLLDIALLKLQLAAV